MSSTFNLFVIYSCSCSLLWENFTDFEWNFMSKIDHSDNLLQLRKYGSNYIIWIRVIILGFLYVNFLWSIQSTYIKEKINPQFCDLILWSGYFSQNHPP